MEQLKTGSFTALTFNARLTLTQMDQHVGTRAQELYQLAAANNLFVAGPVYWIYDGADGNPDTVFDLKIALPVIAPSHAKTLPQLETIPTFHSLTTSHAGPWQTLNGTYCHISEEVAQRRLQPTGICRELYLQIDFDHPENNLTLVMFGIS